MYLYFFRYKILIGKEYFKIEPKEAKKIAVKFAKSIEPISNKNAILFKKLRDKKSKSNIEQATKSLWGEIAKLNQNSFIKEAVKLILKEGKLGQPQYERFSALRNHSDTEMGRFDLYVCKDHLRIVVTTENQKKAKQLLNKRFDKDLKITNWEHGISFYIWNAKQFNNLQQWLKLGKREQT